MKYITVQRLSVFLLASSLAVVARGDGAAYGKIVKDREAVLSEILSTREGRLQTGAENPEAVFSARISLLKFRRDIAASLPEKLKQQALIARAYESRLAKLDAGAKAGTVDPEDRLIAKEQMLEQMQTLEAMKQSQKSG